MYQESPIYGNAGLRVTEIRFDCCSKPLRDSDFQKTGHSTSCGIDLS